MKFLRDEHDMLSCIIVAMKSCIVGKVFLTIGAILSWQVVITLSHLSKCKDALNAGLM